ncbi:hypothetical protein [Shinella sp.]|uniref:hypothetical protein n=1 Tax=Shinella sp. TaxID=1870904 RepID=UPI0040374FEC
MATLGVQEEESLTNGAFVNLVIIDPRAYDAIDTSDIDDDVLLVGLSNADRVKAGGGDDHLYGGDGNDQIIGGKGIDRLYGNADADIMVTGETSLTNLVSFNLNTENTEWDDGVTDYMSGGSGADIYLVYSDRTYFDGPSSEDFMMNAFNNEIDFVGSKDEISTRISSSCFTVI